MTSDNESEINSQELASSKKKQKFKDDLRFMGWFLLIFLSFRFFVFDYFIIPSSSMVPTLLVGDMPLVEKWPYGYSKHSMWFSPPLFSGRLLVRRPPRRGEVIVFKEPKSNDINVIKRVIALPGDKIRVVGGVIHVNGEPAKLTYKETRTYYDQSFTNLYDRIYEIKIYEETMPACGVKHLVAYDSRFVNSKANYFPEITVPEGYYFVMGDNRDHSNDSRLGLGMIPEENLMGRAICTIYSIDNCVRLWEFWLWFQNIRYSRILKSII